MSLSSARAGVVGLGRHGLRHLQAYSRLDETQIVAVCDVRAEAVAAALEQHPSARGYASWEEMLREERLDILSVVTNGPAHAPVAVEAARRGVGRILCEKPMATSVKDAKEMIRACRVAGTRLALAHGRRWHEPYRRLRALFDEGVIGKLCHFSSVLGGGLFAGNGTHAMDLARMLSRSEPVSVTGFIDRTGTPNPRGAEFQDPGAVAVYWFENGMRVVIDMFEDLGVAAPLEIVGQLGRATIDEGAPRWQILARRGDDREKPPGQYWLPLHAVEFEAAPLDMIEMLTDALRELLGEGQISCTGDDGLAALQMVIGAHASSREGSAPVRLPLAEEYERIDIPLT